MCEASKANRRYRTQMQYGFVCSTWKMNGRTSVSAINSEWTCRWLGASQSAPIIPRRRARVDVKVVQTSTRVNQVPRMTWVERAAHVVVEATPDETFDRYIDLETMPEWSPWLRRVEVDPSDGSLSRWVLGARGMEVSWLARIVEVDRGRVIRWESVTGLRNRGRVEFSAVPSTTTTTTTITRDTLGSSNSGEDKGHHTRVRLAVAVDLPQSVARMAAASESAGRMVEDTLAADLGRFRTTVLAHLARERRVASRLHASPEHLEKKLKSDGA